MRLCLLATLAAAMLFAQTPPAPRFSALQSYLGLSDTQVQQLQSIRQQVASSLASNFSLIRQKQQALDDLLKAGGADPATVGQLLLAIDGLRKQTDSALATARTQELALLTADQKAKLQTLGDAEKLQRSINEAVMLNLLDSQTGVRGFGLGFRGLRDSGDPGAARFPRQRGFARGQHNQ
jgi:Spy/CpxP family protein refolding chaperone